MCAFPRWHRFRELSPARRALVAEAAFWLIAARLAIWIVPFPWMARRIGRLRAPEDSDRVERDDDEIRGIAWAIDRAARNLPLRLVCLPRALAAWRMLSRRAIPARVHFGASRGAGQRALATHAWVDAGGVEVTGYPEAYNCVEIGYFTQ